MKKAFLEKDHEKTKFYPVLSEFFGIASWSYQVRHFEKNFRGLIPYFHQQPEGSFGVDYLWITENTPEDDLNEERFRKTLQENFLDSIRESVKAIGSVGEGRRILSPDYKGLSDSEK